MPESFVLSTPRGAELHGVVHSADLPGRRPAVVICHGFKGFQEWGFFPYLAELLAERGFTAIRFNFSGCGMRPGDELVTDLEAFRTATLTGDLHDLLFLLGHLDEVASDQIDLDRLGLFGHSRGGGTAILASAHPAWRDRVKALVTWSAVASYDRASEEEKQAWRALGSVPVINARTGQELELGTEVLDDIEQNAAELDVLAAAGDREAPWLIVHGKEDETVPVEEARELAEHGADPVVLLEIAGAGHTLEVGHPFQGPTPELIEALNATQIWFRKTLVGTTDGS